MLKEIYEQPEVIQKCLDLHVLPSSFVFDAQVEQVHLLACGTSLHASLVGQYLFEQIAEIPTIVRSASEYLAAPLPLTRNTLTIAVTQSGETTDTITAVKLVRSRAAQLPHRLNLLLAITNQAESTIAQLVDQTIVTPAGVEVGVAATKTFLAQLMAFYSLAFSLAAHRSLENPQRDRLLTELQQIPDQIRAILQQDQTICALAEKLRNTSNLIVLGSGINTAIALEGALKLKETTYIHAEGYAAGEFLHGPIALLDDKIPVVALAPAGVAASTVIKTAQKAQTNGSFVIGVGTTEQFLPAAQQQILLIPSVHEWLSPLLTVIPLQLLAYHLAVIRQLNVDRPRNLTKSLSG